MAYNEKSYQASVRYKAQNIKRIPLDVQLEKYAEIQAAAAAAGESVNGYIKKAIDARISRERRPSGPILRLQYYVEFGKGDNSDPEDWDVEISEDLRRQLDICIRKVQWERYDQLCKDAISAAYPDILEKVKADLEDAGDEWSDGYNIVVSAPFTNEYE